MINVICTSNFNELDSIKDGILRLGYKFKHKPIVEIEFIDLSTESQNLIIESNVCIFQSKNAITHAKTYRGLFDKNKDYYAVGLFTAKSVKESIQVNCKYPKNNYSSEDLIKEYKLNTMEGKKVVIMRGEGGLKIIRESLKKKNIVNEVIAYKRIINKNIINSKDFDANSINVIISMSQDALKSLCEKNDELIKNRNTILIVPNERFISEKIKIFKKIHTLKSSEFKREILDIIRNTE